MAKKSSSRILRELAENLIRQVAQDEAIPEDDQRDLVTSLVRQWVTYDGHATLFAGEHQLFFHLGSTPLGKLRIIPEPGVPFWFSQVIRDWKIDPEHLDDIIDQLNRGQSAEVVNGEGIPLRLWVDPLKKGHGIEPLAKRDHSSRAKRDYRKIAHDELEKQFGHGLDTDEMEQLTCSVAKQWQQYQGHACLFLGNDQLMLTITEQQNGSCSVKAMWKATEIEGLLGSLGLPAESVPEVIVRMNLCQTVEFHDQRGIPSRLWHDPQARKVRVESVRSSQPRSPAAALPIFCPKCSAVLRPWRPGEKGQSCPLCGHTISLS